LINPLDLTGRRILVTGASSGIGRATALLLSQLGAELVLVGRDPDRLAATASALDGSGHAVEPFDLCRSEDLPEWLKMVAKRQGALTGFIHSAGTERIRPIRFITLDSWRQFENVNLTAALLLLKAYRQKGVFSSPGSIVLISSVAGIVGQAGHAEYCATKAALIAIAKSAALEFAADGIRVNCIAPGWVEETAMADNATQQRTPEQMEALKARQPLGNGKPRDVAYGAAFLLSDAARWITGTTLVMDGGYTAQ
jgi:NAD(P)-dependent dehydrogenase (short-subunit alcohol dehydrogenase family)